MVSRVYTSSFRFYFGMITLGMSITDLIRQLNVEELAIPSNFTYGKAIYQRNAVKLIECSPTEIEAWVGGLTGSVIEGGGSRRRTAFFIKGGDLKWHCAVIRRIIRSFASTV